MAYHKAIAGAGWVSLIPNGVTNPTPIHVALVSGSTFDLKEEYADLRGEGPDILDRFRTARTLSGKLTISEFSVGLLGAATGGVTVSAGTKLGASHSAVIPTTPFQITVTNGATFADDMGVINLTDGKQMTRGATASATNVYSVNTTTGVYTFNTADAGDSVLIMYRYTAASQDQTAAVAAVTNDTGAKYAIHCYATKAGKSWGFYVPSASIPGLSASFKRDGWSEVSLDWTAMLSSTNELFYMYAKE